MLKKCFNIIIFTAFIQGLDPYGGQSIMLPYGDTAPGVPPYSFNSTEVNSTENIESSTSTPPPLQLQSEASPGDAECNKLYTLYPEEVINIFGSR